MSRQKFRESLLRWSSSNLRDFPWRETTDPYDILVAEILLQKTPAERVKPVYMTFLERYPCLSDLAEANVDDLAELLYPLGLQNQRARAFVEIGEQLEGHGVPKEEDGLLGLPYVGRYAANATLCFAFDEPRAIVDSNVVRVYERAFGLNLNENDAGTWKVAQDILPKEEARRYNLAIIDFGATICTGKAPSCGKCFYSDDCTEQPESSVK